MDLTSAREAWIASSPSTGFKKKLYAYRPDRHTVTIEANHTKESTRQEDASPAAIERGIRQILANKVSGNMMGLWLLVPEHLRMGTWDLLTIWSGNPTTSVEPRLALQLVSESALCVPGIRKQRALSQRGFELANGLPFVATDQAIHRILDAHTVAQAQSLQVQLGLVRQARGHFLGKILAIDPHRIRSYSKRQMVRRKTDKNSKPGKAAQTFFCLDADTKQPLCFTSATSSMSVSRATKNLATLMAEILPQTSRRPLILADTEHYSNALIDHFETQTPFDLLLPMPNFKSLIKKMRSIPDDMFSPQWAGFATARTEYNLNQSETGPHLQLIQRSGEIPENYVFKSFLTTAECDEAEALTIDYPKRWHIEEFFHANQALGWDRAGTMNLNIRYGQMTMALLAQSVIHEFRKRLGKPYDTWDAKHLADHILNGVDGDIRVRGNTVIVTYYNAPNQERLRHHYENLPSKLEAENVDPRMPWLYNFKLDFRFK